MIRFRSPRVFALVSIGCAALLASAAFADRGSLREPGDISGQWRLRLVVEAGRPGGTPVRSPVTGQLALIRARAYPGVEWAAGLEYLGVFDAPVEPLGVDPPDQREIPVAAARRLGTDSVVIVLNPGIDHGVLIMRGRVRGDSVAGRWEVTAYALGAHGSFVLSRQ